MKLYRLARGVDEEVEAVPARAAILVELSQIVDRGLVAAQKRLMNSGDHRYSTFLAELTGAIAAQIQPDESGFIWVIPEKSGCPKCHGTGHDNSQFCPASAWAEEGTLKENEAGCHPCSCGFPEGSSDE